MPRATARQRHARHALSVLAALRCPLIGIWGALDPIIGPHREARRAALLALRPDAQICFIEDAGHWVQYEAPEAFNTIALTALPPA